MQNRDALHMIVTGELMPRGDGTYILKAGKPVRWLWTRDAARLYGVSTDTIIRWWRGGFIIGQKVGPRRIRIDSDSIAGYVAGPPKPDGSQSFQRF